MSVEISSSTPNLVSDQSLASAKAHSNFPTQDLLKMQFISLSYYDILEEKLAKRTKSDLEKLELYLSKS